MLLKENAELTKKIDFYELFDYEAVFENFHEEENQNEKVRTGH